jgi:uncharacterized RDD family membrane protein YckC
MKACSYCGNENNDDATRCFQCGTELLESAESSVAPSAEKSRTAGFGIHVLARMVDSMFGLFIGFAGGVLAAVVLLILNAMGRLSPGWQQRAHELSLASFGFSVLGAMLYHLICEGMHGATLGKLCFRIRVMSENGQPSTLKGALIRSLGYWIDSFFFGLVGYEAMKKSPLNQRYGDRWGKTVVFKDQEVPPELQRTPVRFTIGLLLGAVAWVLPVVASTILKAL